MSLNDILGSAMSGLNAAQAGLRAVSSNIANVNTTGYAREAVSLSASVTGGVVTGVSAGEPTRIASSFLDATVYTRAGDVGSAEVTSDYLGQLQSLLGSASASAGLSAQLDAVDAAAVAMTGSPITPQTAAAFTSSVQGAIGTMQRLDGDVSSLQGNVDAQVGSTVERVNALLKTVYDLNATVAAQQGLGQSAAGAADQRTAALQELSGLAKVTVRTQPDGRVAIDTASGTTLLDQRLRQLSYPTTGTGVAQPSYPAIDIRFADQSGAPGASTGTSIASSAVGGQLGGLIDLRDRVLPQFADKLGTLFGGMARSLNAASNASSTVPPPATLTGGQTALTATDRLGFTGAAVFAVTSASGTLVASTRIDFAALGPNATVADAVSAIDGGLGGAGTASFSGGVLTIGAAGSGNGVAVAQDPATPSDRAGAGFAQYFGLNDLVQSNSGPLTPSGFTAADPTGFAAGQTAQVVLRDASGRALSSYALTGGTGQTFGDVVSQLNQSSLGSFGSFAVDAKGRVQFQPNSSVAGAAITIPADSTDRFGTGRSFTTISGLTGAASGLGTAKVRPGIAAAPSSVPLAQLQTGAAVGTSALGAADTSGAAAYVDRLAQPLDLGQSGSIAAQDFANQLLATAGSQASDAQATLTDATARRDDAVSRRDSFSGVNIDQELSQMVVLQNSYSAAARVISAASQMYETLIGMVTP